MPELRREDGCGGERMTFGELLDVISFNQIVSMVVGDGVISGQADSLRVYLYDDVLALPVNELCAEKDQIKVWIGVGIDEGEE